MKLTVALTIVLFNVMGFALSKPAKLSYFENVSNEPMKLSFKINGYCPSPGAPLDVQEFYSQKEYKSADSGKMVPVRIVHVYVKSNASDCKKVEAKGFEKILDLPVVQMMTHIYVTTDPNVKVQSVQ